MLVLFGIFIFININFNPKHHENVFFFKKNEWNTDIDTHANVCASTHMQVSFLTQILYAK